MSVVWLWRAGPKFVELTTLTSSTLAEVTPTTYNPPRAVCPLCLLVHVCAFPIRQSLVPSVPFPLEFRLASEAFWGKMTEGPALKSVLSFMASARLPNVYGPQFLHLYHGSIVSVNDCKYPATVLSLL